MMTIIEIRLIMVCIYFVNTVKAYMMLMSMPVTELQRNLKISKKLFKWYCLKYLLKLLKWEIGLGQLIHFSWRDFWGGDRVAGGGGFGVFAVGCWLSLMVIRAMLRKYMALSKNWIFILYLHSSKIWDTMEVLKRNYLICTSFYLWWNVSEDNTSKLQDSCYQLKSCRFGINSPYYSNKFVIVIHRLWSVDCRTWTCIE